MMTIDDLSRMLRDAVVEKEQADERHGRAAEAHSRAEDALRSAGQDAQLAANLVTALRELLWRRGIEPDEVLKL